MRLGQRRLKVRFDANFKLASCVHALTSSHQCTFDRVGISAFLPWFGFHSPAEAFDPQVPMLAAQILWPNREDLLTVCSYFRVRWRAHRLMTSKQTTPAMATSRIKTA